MAKLDSSEEERFSLDFTPTDLLNRTQSLGWIAVRDEKAGCIVAYGCDEAMANMILNALRSKHGVV
jgi:hypothetical protein